jgi:F1F0 ATPase subunit 2
MKNEIPYMGLAFVAGLLLGTLFFGGLWLTVKKAVTSKMPAIWFSLSFLFRVSVTLAGFYFIANNNWKRLVICLFGFVIARFIIMRLTKSNEKEQIKLKKEVMDET